MYLTITKEAQDYLNQNGTTFTLVAQHVGCTCSQDSIVQLIIDRTNESDTILIPSNWGTFYITSPLKLELEDQLTLSFQQKYLALSLSGEHLGLINPRVLLLSQA